jgi:Skp family chaperone for outer membrane proteins
MNQQNCNVMAADFMNCLLTNVANKVNKKVLSKLKNPLKKVDAQLNKLHKEIAAETFKAGGMMEQYVGRNLRAAEKLTKQLDIMTR